LSLLYTLPDFPYILHASSPCLWSVTTGVHTKVTVLSHFQVSQKTHTRKYTQISRNYLNP